MRISGCHCATVWEFKSPTDHLSEPQGEFESRTQYSVKSVELKLYVRHIDIARLSKGTEFIHGPLRIHRMTFYCITHGHFVMVRVEPELVLKPIKVAHLSTISHVDRLFVI
jgi:hypothetical protein